MPDERISAGETQKSAEDDQGEIKVLEESVKDLEELVTKQEQVIFNPKWPSLTRNCHDLTRISLPVVYIWIRLYHQQSSGREGRIDWEGQITINK